MKVLVGAFNQEKALVDASSVIVKLQTSRRLVSRSTVKSPQLGGTVHSVTRSRLLWGWLLTTSTALLSSAAK